MNTLTTRLAHRQRGLSMIELMVGMAIGLIGTVIIAAALIANEDYKRRTVGASDSQVNGALALYAIERDLRMSGFGFSNTNALGCASVSYTRSSFSGTYPSFGLYPFKITQGGTTAPDSIQVVYSTEASRSLPGVLNGSITAGATSATLNDSTGYIGSGTSTTVRGDLVVLASGSTCTMVQVTATDTANKTMTFAAVAPFNAGTTAPALPSGSYVFNLGLPVVRAYSVGSNQSLQMLDVFSTTATNVIPTVSTTPITIVSGVVDLQADYGLDTDNNGIVDTYSTTSPTTAAGWGQVLAVRIAVLVRSQNYFRPSTPGGACEATTAAPTWTGGTHYMSDTLPSCYKYRSFETVVPVRNMIWKEA